MKKYVVVNDKDEIIGYKSKAEMTDDEICRVSGVWILNEKGEALIAQRARTKRYDPLKWAVSAAGTVEEGETYLENVIKETREELGITIEEKDLIPGPHVLVKGQHFFFYQSYFLRRDIAIEDITIQKEEVEAVRWISVPELKKWFSERPEDFLKSFPVSMTQLEEFCKRTTKQ